MSTPVPNTATVLPLAAIAPRLTGSVDAAGHAGDSSANLARPDHRPTGRPSLVREARDGACRPSQCLAGAQTESQRQGEPLENMSCGYGHGVWQVYAPVLITLTIT